VGDNDSTEEKAFGQLLAPYLKDATNVFIVSSDFCHWGSRFSYTAYCPKGEISQLKSLSHRAKTPTDPPIHESIQVVDQAAMDAIETGVHAAFVENLRLTRNTVCGRHPIGVMMAALEAVRNEREGKGCKFKFVRYERSSLVEDADDSSVSYASAYAAI
jgi:AmmeMemoRadiSam system protein B